MRLLCTHPITGDKIYEGDVVRKYRYNKDGNRDGLTKPYEVVFYKDVGFILREARYLDYLDTIGPGQELIVFGQSPEDLEHIAVSDEDKGELKKVIIDNK